MNDAINPAGQMEITEPTLHNLRLLSRIRYKPQESVQWAMFVAWTMLAAAIAISAGLARSETPGQLARVKDVATIEGIRDNQLVGYGLVVGLRGTGDSSQTVFP